MRWKGRWAKATKQLKGTLKEVESNEPRVLVTDWWPTSVSSLLPGALACPGWPDLSQTTPRLLGSVTSSFWIPSGFLEVTQPKV